MKTRRAIAAALLTVYLTAMAWTLCNVKLPATALADDWPFLASAILALAGYGMHRSQAMHPAADSLSRFRNPAGALWISTHQPKSART
jgi:hypothetical protein